MVNILLKKLSISLAALLLPFSKAYAWVAPIWLTNLSETVGGRDADQRREITCVALAVYYESRGESLRGQRAVASVVMNRKHSSRFGGSACEVIHQRGQFSFVRGQALRPTGAPWQRSIEIATEFVDRDRGEVPYLYFTNSSRLRGYRIGHHVFR